MMKTSELRLTTNLGLLSFFELLQAIDDGKPVDLLRMQAVQRAPIVTALAITMHVIRRYAVTQPVDWESEWLRQVGDLTVVDGPLDEPGFFQMPFSSASGSLKCKSLDIISVNPTIASMNHEYKGKPHATVEDYVLALLSSHWRIYVSQYGSVTGREGLTVVLPSLDGSLASEVSTLETAYRAYAPSVSVAGSQVKPQSAADHFLWMHPWVNQTPVNRVPYPYFTTRPIRLTGDGAIGLYGEDYKRRIVGHTEDPHVPMLGGEPLRLVLSRTYTIQYQHACLFGSRDFGSKRQAVTPAPILALTQSRFVRICGHGSGQSATLGFWENAYCLSTTQRRSLFKSEAERATVLSTRALGALVSAELALKSGLNVLLDIKDGKARRSVDKGIISAARMECSAGAAVQLTQAVLDLLSKPEEQESEQSRLATIAAASAKAVFAKHIDVHNDILRAAQAQLAFNFNIRKLEGGGNMTGNLDADAAHEGEVGGQKDLVKVVFAVLQSIQSRLTPQDRASLRTMDQVNPPLMYWSLLVQVPPAQADAPAAERVWRATIPALGVIRAGRAPVGRVLFETAMPQMRLQQLLASTGDRLVELITEAVRWIVAREIESCDIATLCALGIADALGDREATSACRKRIAMDFARAELASKRVARQETEAAKGAGA